MNKKSKIFACILSASLCIGNAPLANVQVNAELSLTNAVESINNSEGGITINADKISTNNFKDTNYNNPVSSDFFCADPTSVEYDGRLYLIGTNDHEQFEIAGSEVDNTYEKIKSFLIFSTDDMVNWTYHGEINVGEIAPWIVNSWAPSITSRVEADGLTHFYLYFSNNGLGVGVIHTTDLLGTWDDPLGQPLVSTSTPGLKDCPNPFDPGVVIDDNGVGWLAFGAGKASTGTDVMPGSARIVKLGDDMVSFASEFAEIPAPYLFEASELNYINGTYVYTYCSDWADHSKEWNYDCDAPAGCGMVYMTTKTPLDPESWEVKGECFVNPGVSGFDYSNNHTHMHKFNGNWYMFYHTLSLKRGMGITGSYRSMAADVINVDETNVTIEKTGGTKKGLSSISHVNPFDTNLAAELNNTADISYDTSDMKATIVSSKNEGSWFSVKDVEFTSVPQTETEKVTLEKTAVDSIQYNITVTDVDMDTTVSMYPATNDGVDCIGSVEVSGAGSYTITCDMNGADGLMNMGYFKVDNDAKITFVIDSITINDKYNIDISSELTNTREWADGLRNIWNGFSDGDKVYYSDYAEFRYVKADDAIELFASDSVPSSDKNAGAEPLANPVSFFASVKGTGRVEVRLDSPTGDVLTSIDFNSADSFSTIKSSNSVTTGGVHDLYFVFSDKDIAIESWTFASDDDTPETTTTTSEDTTTTTVEDTTTESSEDTTTTESQLGDVLYGDANCDEKVTLADAVTVLQSIANKDKYPLSEQGAKNADCYNVGDGVTAMDALSIQKYDSGAISELPEK